MNRELPIDDDGRVEQQRLKIHEIDLLALARDAWGAKYFILILLVLSVFFSVFSVWTAKPVFTAKMLVGPPEQVGTQGLGGGLAQLSGAASMLGLNIGGGGTGNVFIKYQSVLESSELAAAMLKHEELTTAIFGPGWDPVTRTWARPTGLMFELKDTLKGLLGLPRWTPPDIFSMQTKLKKMMKVTPDRQTSFVSISLDADTPQMAQMLLGVVYKEADNVLRRSQQEYSSNRIAYLTKELDRTTLADQRQAIIAILSVQEQRLMMASADRNVAIDVIDEPYAPLLPSSPQPRVVLATYAFFAGVLGMLMALLHGLRQRQRHGTSVTIDQRLFGWVRRKR